MFSEKRYVIFKGNLWPGKFSKLKLVNFTKIKKRVEQKYQNIVFKNLKSAQSIQIDQKIPFSLIAKKL